MIQTLSHAVAEGNLTTALDLPLASMRSMASVGRGTGARNLAWLAALVAAPGRGRRAAVCRRAGLPERPARRRRWPFRERLRRDGRAPARPAAGRDGDTPSPSTRGSRRPSSSRGCPGRTAHAIDLAQGRVRGHDRGRFRSPLLRTRSLHGRWRPPLRDRGGGRQGARSRGGATTPTGATGASESPRPTASGSTR